MPACPALPRFPRPHFPSLQERHGSKMAFLDGAPPERLCKPILEYITGGFWWAWQGDFLVLRLPLLLTAIGAAACTVGRPPVPPLPASLTLPCLPSNPPPSLFTLSSPCSARR